MNHPKLLAFSLLCLTILLTPSKQSANSQTQTTTPEGFGPCRCKDEYPAKSYNSGCQHCYPGCFQMRVTGRTFVCRSCIDHCSECYNKNSCFKCFPGYALNNDYTKCVGCHVANCVQCLRNENTCTLCGGGYYLTSGRCAPCLPHCSACISSDSCVGCNQGYQWDPSKKACVAKLSLNLS